VGRPRKHEIELTGAECRALARVAADRGLQVDLPHTLQVSHEEGVDRDQSPGMWRLDVDPPERHGHALLNGGMKPESVR
jgi:hypothetical protein